jgi:hypothetical protein
MISLSIKFPMQDFSEFVPVCDASTFEGQAALQQLNTVY